MRARIIEAGSMIHKLFAQPQTASRPGGLALAPAPWNTAGHRRLSTIRMLPGKPDYQAGAICVGFIQFQGSAMGLHNQLGQVQAQAGTPGLPRA